MHRLKPAAPAISIVLVDGETEDTVKSLMISLLLAVALYFGGRSYPLLLEQHTTRLGSWEAVEVAERVARRHGQAPSGGAFESGEGGQQCGESSVRDASADMDGG